MERDSTGGSHGVISLQRVLTMEWIDGAKVTDVESIRAQGLDLVDVDQKLITLMGEQIFHTGFVHGDPHPGNGIRSSVKQYFAKQR